jgi:hypothetical protein
MQEAPNYTLMYMGNARLGVGPTAEWNPRPTPSITRCVSCGSKVSHYSHCAFFRGTSVETKLTLADRAMLERHAAELFAMAQPVSDAVRAECMAELERGRQNDWRCGI